MRSPLGLFVPVVFLVSDYSEAEVRSWFDRIVRDYRRRGSPNYMETLALVYIAKKEPNESIALCQPELNRIKDYLPQFDSLFIGSLPPKAVVENFNIRNANHRSAYLNATLDAAGLFVRYRRDNNITIPIHWYIEPEPELNYLHNHSDYRNAYKAYISSFTNAATQLSYANGLNEPEFLLSPYFAFYPSAEDIEGVINGISDLLVNVPKLRWLHVQDGVGAHSKKHPDGTITYGLKPEHVIAFYKNILVPAAADTNVRSNLINMEFFVFTDDDSLVPGDPLEHEDRQCKYMRAGVPIGISFDEANWGRTFNEIVIPSLKNVFADKGISFPASIKEVAHDLGLPPPISIKGLVRCMRH
jgi:hypothetical protein